MQVALMVPGHIDVFYPHVGIATLELLEQLGVDVVTMCKLSSSFRQQSNMEI